MAGYLFRTLSRYTAPYNTNYLYLRHAHEREFLEAQVLVLSGTLFARLTHVDARSRQRSQRHAVTQEHDYVFGDAFFIHVLDFLGYRGLTIFDPEPTVCM